MATFTGCRILDAERHTETMTAAAELALVHLLHHPALVCRPRGNDGIMTITAVIPFFGMRLMAELDVTGIGGKLITDRARCPGVALHAVGLYTEGRFVIMATAAGFALLHLAHGEMFISVARYVEIRMAILAAIGGNMYRMAEYGAAGTKIDLFDRMAFLAVRFHPKGGLAIMAGTA